MLQIHSTQTPDRIQLAMRTAAARHGGRVLAIGDAAPAEGAGALTFTLCFSDLYDPLLRADIRFAAFLPARVAACVMRDGVSLTAMSPLDCCRLLHRPDLESAAAALERTMQSVMQEAAHHQESADFDRRATEDMINMRAALPQRVDCHGTKIEELAGTGTHDAQGG